MKKLIIALIFCLIALPAMADSWTFDFTTEGDVDHIIIYHKAMPDAMTAEDFVASGGFSEVTIGVTSPQTFTLDYTTGEQYGLFGRAHSANGDSAPIMALENGILSPTVWVATGIDEIGPAHYQVVIPSGSIPQLVTNSNMTQEP